MVKRNNLIILFVTLTVLLIQCNFKIKVQTPHSCKKYLSRISSVWQNDSLGTLGYRDYFSIIINERCDLVGMNWDEVRGFLGKPNEERNNSYTYYSKIDSIYSIQTSRYIEKKEHVTIEVDNKTKKIIRFKKQFIH